MSRTIFKIAVRELLASRTKFLFVIFAVAAGVAALTGVRGFSSSFSQGLLRQARALMAADVSARLFQEPNPQQQAVVDSLVKRRVQYTQVTETISMISPSATNNPVLVTLKAVDPAVYPFYGALELNPAGSLRSKLTATTVVVSEDLRLRLGVNVGDKVQVGGQEFTIAAVLGAEPDRISGTFNVGPRVLIAREGLARTTLLGLGSRASQRLLFRLNSGAPRVERVAEELRKAFPEALVTDYRELNPNIARGLDRSTTFLSFVSLIALVIGSVGVGMAMHAHLQSKLDSVAIMKSIGARSGQVLRIYLAQTILLGLLGGLLGIIVGIAVQRAFPYFLARYFQVQTDIAFDPVPALQGLLIGILTAVLFTVPALMGVTRIRPALVFRREMQESRAPWRTRLKQGWQSILVALLICLTLSGIAAWLAGGSWTSALRLGGFFVGGLLASLTCLWLASEGLIRVLRWATPRLPASVLVRQALANLYRPGSQGGVVLTALGIGVMFTLTVYLVQHSVVREISGSAPPGMANVFFLDITPQQQADVLSLIKKSAGAESNPQIMPTVSCRLVAVDGVTMDKLDRRRFSRRYRMARAVSTFERPPANLEVVSGKWWEGQQTEEAQISVAQGAARALNLKVGSLLTWDSFGRTIETRVAAIHRFNTQTLVGTIEFITSPGALEGLPSIYYAAARVAAPRIAVLQRDSYARFPTVTVVNVADVMDRIQEIVDQISIVIRFISSFTVFTGAIILAASIAGTRFRRIREVVILKSMGATRGRIARMFSIEFAVLGLVAGFIGSILASSFAALVLRQFFEAPYQPDWLAMLLAMLATAVVACAAGWLASFRILGQKPLEVLRAE